MPNYAVIDVGSNSIRLVVYAVPNDAQSVYTRNDFSTLANDKVMAGLASYIAEGVFTPAGIKKATSTIKAHLKHASYFGCKKVSVFATAVLRNAKNSAEAITAIEAGAGCKIDLISGEDEALLGFAGASSEICIANGVAVDIGGGSTELTLVKDGAPLACKSIPQGSLSSFSGHVEGVLPTSTEAAAIRAAFGDKLRSSIDVAAYRTDKLYGIGGSIRAAAKMMMVRSDDRTRPKTLRRGDIEGLLHACAENPSRYAHDALSAAPERVHTLTPGCVILSEIMRELDAKEIRVCKCGIREGYLITRVLKAKVAHPCS